LKKNKKMRLEDNKLFIDFKQLVETNIHFPQFNVIKSYFFSQINCTYSDQTVIQLCKCCHQVSFEDIRIEMAKRKVEAEEYIIKEISYQFCFYNPQSFSRRLNLKILRTPTEYKNTVIQSNF